MLLLEPSSLGDGQSTCLPYATAWVKALPPQKPNQIKLSHDLYTNSGSPMLETHFCQVGHFLDNLNLNFSLSFSSIREFGYYISL